MPLAQIHLPTTATAQLHLQRTDRRVLVLTDAAPPAPPLASPVMFGDLEDEDDPDADLDI
jgi:hypothetical protein